MSAENTETPSVSSVGHAPAAMRGDGALALSGVAPEAKADERDATVIKNSDVFWNMDWGACKKPDGSPCYPDAPAVEIVFEESAALARLLAEEVCFINAYWWKKDWPEDARKVIAICVNCNDIFAWGCADAEELEHEDVQDLYEHWLKDKRDGPSVWCCKKRRQMPQAAVRKHIEAAGIWDLASMGLEPSWYDKHCAERATTGSAA